MLARKVMLNKIVDKIRDYFLENYKKIDIHQRETRMIDFHGCHCGCLFSHMAKALSLEDISKGHPKKNSTHGYINSYYKHKRIRNKLAKAIDKIIPEIILNNLKSHILFVSVDGEGGKLDYYSDRYIPALGDFYKGVIKNPNSINHFFNQLKGELK